jgi:hypothetical protein
VPNIITVSILLSLQPSSSRTLRASNPLLRMSVSHPIALYPKREDLRSHEDRRWRTSMRRYVIRIRHHEQLTLEVVAHQSLRRLAVGILQLWQSRLGQRLEIDRYARWLSSRAVGRRGAARHRSANDCDRERGSIRRSAPAAATLLNCLKPVTSSNIACRQVCRDSRRAIPLELLTAASPGVTCPWVNHARRAVLPKMSAEPRAVLAASRPSPIRSTRGVQACSNGTAGRPL